MEFKVVTFYSTGSKVEEIYSADNFGRACETAHNKAIKQRHYIKSIMVYNEFGRLSAGWSRAYGNLKSIFG